jgi:elongation factor P
LAGPAAITPALFESADLNLRAPLRPGGGRFPEGVFVMSKIAGNEIRPGAMVEHQGSLWIAVKTQAVKPGKGGAYNQVELKNIETGTKLNERFRSSEMVEEIHLDKKDFQFLFASDDMLTFMDMESYEQIELATDFVGEQAQFLSDGMKVMLRLHEGRPLSIQLPQQVTVTVAEADPVLRGGTAAPSFKNAVLENGLKIQVPPFIDAGEKIVVNTEDGSYVRRAEV